MEIITQALDTRAITIAMIRDDVKKISLQDNEKKTGKINLSLDLNNPQYIEVENKKTEIGEIFRCNYFRKTPDGEVKCTFTGDVYLPTAERDIGIMLDAVEAQMRAEQEDREREAFEEKCYELYQLEWMMSHGFSLMDFAKGIQKRATEDYDRDDYIDDEGGFDVLDDDIEGLLETATHDFIEDDGFGNGTMFVCKDEFLNVEYQHPQYMAWLFNTQVDIKAEKMRQLYKKYTGIDANECYDLKVHTTAGELRAYRSQEKDNPGIIVMLKPKGYDEEIDVAQALVYETPEAQKTSLAYTVEGMGINDTDVEISIHGDAKTEDYTHLELIKRQDVIAGLGTETSESQMN